MDRTPPPFIALALAAVLAGVPGCSSLQRTPKSADPQAVGQLTSHRAADQERLLRMGRDVLRQKNLQDKYDIDTATAYDRGDHWEVCFTPKSGMAKSLRKRCFIFRD